MLCEKLKWILSLIGKTHHYNFGYNDGGLCPAVGQLKAIHYYLLAARSFALDYENEHGPDYGTKWLLYMDENGTTHEMNFSALPQDTRGLMLGRVYFYLYTRRNVDNGELLKVPRGDSLIESKYFNVSNDIRAVTHGWMSQETTEWLQSIKKALLHTADLNVITIDWHELAQNPLYHWSAMSTRYVGKRMAKLLGSLSKAYNLYNTNIHLIGHSLGAQIMGYTGLFSESRIHRITGLDPARPLFELPMMHKNFRLDRSDADFVDIIHTCSGIYGYKQSHGHADFYPNNGKARQPGCEGRQQVIEGCSHGRSHEFFLESVDSDITFIAYPCESWDDFDQGKCKENATAMGYPARNDRWGDFYLHTRNESKYAYSEE